MSFSNVKLKKYVVEEMNTIEQIETRNYLIDLEKKLERSKMEQPIFILGEAPAVDDLLTYDQITVSKSVSMQSLG